MKIFFIEMLPYKLVGIITLLGAFLFGAIFTESIKMMREQGKAEIISQLPLDVLVRMPIKTSLKDSI